MKHENNSNLMFAYSHFVNECISRRKACKWTFETAANHLGVGSGVLFKLEHKEKIDFLLLERYCNMFGIELVLIESVIK